MTLSNVVVCSQSWFSLHLHFLFPKNRTKSICTGIGISKFHMLKKNLWCMALNPYNLTDESLERVSDIMDLWSHLKNISFNKQVAWDVMRTWSEFKDSRVLKASLTFYSSFNALIVKEAKLNPYRNGSRLHCVLYIRFAKEYIHFTP